MKRPAVFLILCCVLWGFSFPAMQLSIDALRAHAHIDGAMPVAAGEELGFRATFLGWRFGFAALITAICVPSVWRGLRREEMRAGMVLGALFAAGMICQLAGLRYARPSVSSFLTSLTVVFTPLAQALVFRRPVAATTWAAVLLAVCGMAFFSVPNPEACGACSVTEAPPFPFFGEALTTLGALFFTAQILVLDRLGPRCDPVRMTLVNFAASGLLCAAVGIALSGATLYTARVVVPLASDLKFVALFAALVVFSSVLAVHCMNRYQRFVSPAVASVIYSSESVFSTLFSLIFQTERLTVFTISGGALILAALGLVTAQQSGTSESASPESAPGLE